MKPDSKVSHQALAQRRNVASGWCQAHRNHPLAPGSKRYCEECLAKWRAKKPPKGTKPSRPRAETRRLYDSVDWLLPAEEIAKSLGVLRGTVLNEARRRGIPAPGQRPDLTSPTVRAYLVRNGWTPPQSGKARKSHKAA